MNPKSFILSENEGKNKVKWGNGSFRMNKESLGFFYERMINLDFE